MSLSDSSPYFLCLLHTVFIHGICFRLFSPANIMKLLEIIRCPLTSAQNIASCLQFGQKIGKTSVIVNDCFGFVGNRMLEPYAKEGLFLLEEGATVAQIDDVLKKQFGFALGLFEMSDLAGVDIGHIAWMGKKNQGTHSVDGVETLRDSSLTDKLFQRGWLGQKTGRGWYQYSRSAPRKPVHCPEVDQLIIEHRAEMVRDNMFGCIMNT